MLLSRFTKYFGCPLRLFSRHSFTCQDDRAEDTSILDIDANGEDDALRAWRFKSSPGHHSILRVARPYPLRPSSL